MRSPSVIGARQPFVTVALSRRSLAISRRWTQTRNRTLETDMPPIKIWALPSLDRRHLEHRVDGLWPDVPSVCTSDAFTRGRIGAAASHSAAQN
jgi:hypothetical protein